MDKWTFRYIVTRDLMLLAVALEALSLYPRNLVIFLLAMPLTMGMITDLLSIVANRE